MPRTIRWTLKMTVRETLKIGFYPQLIGIPHTSEATIVLRTQRLGKKPLTPKKNKYEKNNFNGRCFNQRS